MRLERVAVAAMIVLGAVFCGTVPAAAHDDLVETNPSAGAVLASPPATMSLTFSAELMEGGAVVAVTDSEDTDWTAGTAEVRENVVTTELSASMPDSEYVVHWRVVSSDGHPIAGSFSFAVGAAQESPTPSGSSAVKEPSSPAVEDAGDANGQNSSTVLVVIISAGMAMIAAGIAVVLYRKKVSFVPATAL